MALNGALLVLCLLELWLQPGHMKRVRRTSGCVDETGERDLFLETDLGPVAPEGAALLFLICATMAAAFFLTPAVSPDAVCDGWWLLFLGPAAHILVPSELAVPCLCKFALNI